MSEAGSTPPDPQYPDARVLFVYDRHFSSFIERDWNIIHAAYPNAELFCTGGVKRFFQLRAAVNRADLIFCWFGGRNAFASAFWNRRRKPLMIVAGGYDVSCMPEMRYGTFARFPHAPIGRWLFARADRVLAVSDYAAESAMRFAGVAESRLRLIYHGFDPDAWQPRAVERDFDVFSIVGRDPVRKNLDLMLEAAALLPDRTFRFLGRLTAEQRHTYDIERLRNVRWIERLSDEELHDHYARARVYLQPSRHEAFGCAVAEAMLMGCVPVVADATAQPEVVGEAGVFARPLTGQGVADAVEHAAAQPPEVRARAREQIVKHFGLAHYGERLVGFIDEVLGARGRG